MTWTKRILRLKKSVTMAMRRTKTPGLKKRRRKRTGARSAQGNKNNCFFNNKYWNKMGNAPVSATVIWQQLWRGRPLSLEPSQIPKDLRKKVTAALTKGKLRWRVAI